MSIYTPITEWFSRQKGYIKLTLSSLVPITLLYMTQFDSGTCVKRGVRIGKFYSCEQYRAGQGYIPHIDLLVLSLLIIIGLMWYYAYKLFMKDYRERLNTNNETDTNNANDDTSSDS